MLPDQTRYVQKFSDSSFTTVAVGMSEADVLRLVGQPLAVTEYVGARIYESNWSPHPSAVRGVEFRWWQYSKRGCLTDSYEVRALKFSPDGRVTEVLSRPYGD